MDTKQVINKLRGTADDLEFYPTSYEMLETIYARGAITKASVLDIGCGTCHFKKHFDTWAAAQLARHNSIEQAKFDLAKAKGESYYKRDFTHQSIDQYYVIEKSRPLIDLLDNETICLGTDFYTTNLIDKRVDVIFCNPPYSDYEAWAEKIIDSGNAEAIYLIIPQRWANSQRITNALNRTKLQPNVIGSFDFLEADRVARAKVDIIELRRDRYARKGEFNDGAFDRWFDETFGLGESTDTMAGQSTSKVKQNIKNQIAATSNKAEILVQLYDAEMLKLFGHFQAICALDIDVLETIGIKQDNVKAALKQKLTGLKSLYWEMLFDELDEVTSRLTSAARKTMLQRFTSLVKVEFSHDNIYPLVMWVIKNANAYYTEQLVDFYKSLADPENVKPYKSNQRLFGLDKWRFGQNATHYTLDYRIVAGRMFRNHGWDNRIDEHHAPTVIDDICVVANNLGFAPQPKYKTDADGGQYLNRTMPRVYGEKYYIYMADGSVLVEYKIYKNGNTHLKLNKEFAKAMNVEVARALGWIRDKTDIAKEFTEDMAKGAEKYFKASHTINITSGTLPLLLTSK